MPSLPCDIQLVLEALRTYAQRWLHPLEYATKSPENSILPPDDTVVEIFPAANAMPCITLMVFGFQAQTFTSNRDCEPSRIPLQRHVNELSYLFALNILRIKTILHCASEYGLRSTYFLSLYGAFLDRLERVPALLDAAYMQGKSTSHLDNFLDVNNICVKDIHDFVCIHHDLEGLKL